MPFLIHAPQKTTKKRCIDELVKPVPKAAAELAAQTLSTMWQRLYQSYLHFSQPGCDAFIRDAEPRNAALPGGDAANAAGPSGLRWGPDFAAASTCDALIQHLFLCNEHFDTLSWVIAFCLIDRLQLHHYVRQRLQNISLWKKPDWTPPSLRLTEDDVPQLLFTVYTLAFKWHLDYTVSVKYLANLLPHSISARRAILRATVQDELVVLQVLDYNCAVSQHHITQLMNHFLTSAERSYVFRAVYRS